MRAMVKSIIILFIFALSYAIPVNAANNINRPQSDHSFTGKSARHSIAEGTTLFGAMKQIAITKSCEYCEKEFSIKFKSQHGRKFCSPSCRVSANNKSRVWTMASCLKFSADRRNDERYQGKNNPNWKNAGIVHTCLNCNTEFKTQVGDKKKGKFCSFECWKVYVRANPKHSLSKDEKKLHGNMSRRIRQSLGNKSKENNTWTKIVGYTLQDLITHLESKFLPGMTWQNYGVHGWHIDHRKPISHFTITSYQDEQFLKCWALDNLQPLWAYDNLAKCDLRNKNQNKYQ